MLRSYPYFLIEKTHPRYLYNGILKDRSFQRSSSVFIVESYPYNLIICSRCCIYKWDRKQQKFFSVSSKGTNDPSKERYLLSNLAKKLHIRTPSDWYRVSKCDIMEHGGAELLNQYNGSLVKMITTVYNEYPQRTMQ